MSSAFYYAAKLKTKNKTSTASIIPTTSITFSHRFTSFTLIASLDFLITYLRQSLFKYFDSLYITHQCSDYGHQFPKNYPIFTFVERSVAWPWASSHGSSGRTCNTKVAWEVSNIYFPGDYFCSSK